MIVISWYIMITLYLKKCLISYWGNYVVSLEGRYRIGYLWKEKLRKMREDYWMKAS